MSEIYKILDFMLEAFIHVWPYLVITIPIAVAVNNSGTTSLTVGTVKVNDATIGVIDGSLTFAAGEGRTLTIYMGTGYWTAGNKYSVSLFTADGTLVGSLQDTA